MIRLGIVLTLVAACNLFATAPDFSVPVTDGPGLTIDVYDASGLVAGAGPAQLGAAFSPDGDLVANPESNTLTLRWSGGSCRMRPAVTIFGTADHLNVLVDDEPPPMTPCRAVGIAFALTLTLTKAVTQDALTLEVDQ